jgi:hypothetical protein
MAECSPDLATWAAVAQAAGSILAIWAAGRVVVLQQRLGRVERLDALLGIAGYAVDQLSEAARLTRDANETGALINAPVEPLADAETMLAGIPAHELGSARLVELLAKLRRLVREARPQFAHAREMIKITGDVSSHWDFLDTREQMAIGILAEIGRIHGLARGRLCRWLLW